MKFLSFHTNIKKRGQKYKRKNIGLFPLSSLKIVLSKSPNVFVLCMCVCGFFFHCTLYSPLQCVYVVSICACLVLMRDMKWGYFFIWHDHKLDNTWNFYNLGNMYKLVQQTPICNMIVHTKLLWELSILTLKKARVVWL